MGLHTTNITGRFFYSNEKIEKQKERRVDDDGAVGRAGEE